MDYKLEYFKSGTILKSRDLNAIVSKINQMTKKLKVKVNLLPKWKDNEILTAQSLNDLIERIEFLGQYLELKKIKWSFGHFEDGKILKADHFNEIIDNFLYLEENESSI